jgi:hypothetical protein
MPEVKDVLNRHLDPRFEPTRTIRSVYGRYFPLLRYLDPGWTHRAVAEVFPDAPELAHLWRAAWDSYLVYADNWNSRDVLDLLRRQYSRGVRETVTSATTSDSPIERDPPTQLGWHLVVFFVVGSLDLADPLLNAFFETADDGLRGRVMGWLGRSLLGDKDALSPPMKSRVQDLWDHRFGQCSAEPQAHHRELVSFGWSFASGKLDTVWAFSTLVKVLMLAGRIDDDHFVIERLATLSHDWPLDSIRCFAAMVGGDHESWTFRGEEARDLLRTVLASGNAEASRLAVEVVNRLAARGFLELRALLPTG